MVMIVEYSGSGLFNGVYLSVDNDPVPSDARPDGEVVVQPNDG